MHDDCEVAYLGVTVEELSRVFDAIPSKYFGLTLDIAHASLLPGGVDPFFDAFSDRIISTHVSDNDLYLDRHLPVGEGKIDFKPIFQKLIDINFKGTLNIELPKSNAGRLLSKQRLEPILKELGVLEKE
jgi:sugar phosphate isomerase/epimerase